MSKMTFLPGLVLAVLFLMPPWALADIQGPPESRGFGVHTLLLPNGSLAVSAPGTPGAGGELAVGAVYLYSREGALISVLRGSQAGDAIGNRGFTAVPGSNGFFVRSSSWSNGPAASAGALTWVDGSTGLSGVVGPDNSIVGSSPGDAVGEIAPMPLGDGRLVLHAPSWNNGSAARAGAIRIFNPAAPEFGAISNSNALVGATSDDQIGREFPPLFGVHFSGLAALPDGGLIIRSAMWDRSGLIDAGAITYVAPGESPAGVITAANSLVGSSVGDSLGSPSGNLVALPGGAWMLRALGWDGPVGVNQGAVMRLASLEELVGEISAERALTGAQSEDRVGSGGLTVLPNGAVLVASPNWRNGAFAQAGALTWIAPSASLAGESVGAGNSLVGSRANDRVSALGAKILANGHAVVVSPYWANGDQSNAGAVTWINAETGILGEVSAANSLVGNVASSLTGSMGGDGSVSGVVALANGHYLVRTPAWRPSSEITEAGAVTWGDGDLGSVGTVDVVNSLVGERSGLRVGVGNVRALPDGNVLVHSPFWADSQGVQVGAVSWVSGLGDTVGVLGAQNSWVGSSSGDLSGVGLHAFEDGSSLLTAFTWGGNAGAVLGIPAGGSSGVVGPATSQVGQPDDRLGSGLGQGEVVTLSDGSVLVSSPSRRVLGLEMAGSLHRIAAGASPVGNLLDAEAFTGSFAFDRIGASAVRAIRAAGGEGFVAVSQWLSTPAGDAGRGGLTVWRSNNPSGQIVGADNTLFGESESDFLNATLLPQDRDTHLLFLPSWDREGVEDAGRLIWFDSSAVPGNGLDSTSGRFGIVSGDFVGREGAAQIDWEAGRMVIGLPMSNRVMFLPLSSGTLFADGFEGE